MPKKPLRKRKILSARCPHCDSSQIRFRKILKNWYCQTCHKAFKKPKSDEKTG